MTTPEVETIVKPWRRDYLKELEAERGNQQQLQQPRNCFQLLSDIDEVSSSCSDRCLA